MIYLKLFWEFFKTGLFAIGGGMATIPFLYDISDKTAWFTHNDLANMIAVSESTPGPIGVNMASYVGFISGMTNGGVISAVIGSAISTIGLITPSVIIILAVAAILEGFKDNKYVSSAFYTLRPASTGLIAAAGLSVLFANMFTGDMVGFKYFNFKGLVLAAVLWFLTNKCKKTKNLHPIIFIALSAVAGIVFSM